MPVWMIPIVLQTVRRLIGSSVLDETVLLHLLARAKAGNSGLEVAVVHAVADALDVELPKDEPAKPVV